MPMAARLLDDRSRMLGIAGTALVHLVAIFVILLFAPHGGRRHDPRIPGTHKVNDLWTADVTRDLAAACGASTIVKMRISRATMPSIELLCANVGSPFQVPL